MKKIEDIKVAGSRKVVFASYWREDFVGEALTLILEDDSCIRTMEFYSSRYGITQWNRESGFSNSREWEDLENLADRQRRFPSSLLNGPIPVEKTNFIIAIVLAHNNLTEIKEVIQDGVKASHRKIHIPEKML